jgi:hypothetical protein
MTGGCSRSWRNRGTSWTGAFTGGRMNFGRSPRLWAAGSLARAGFAVVLDEFQYFNCLRLRPFCSSLQAEVDSLALEANRVPGRDKESDMEKPTLTLGKIESGWCAGDATVSRTRKGKYRLWLGSLHVSKG